MNTIIDRTPPDRSIPEERRTQIRRFLAEDLPARDRPRADRRLHQLAGAAITGRRVAAAAAVVLAAVALAVVPGMLSDGGSAFAVRQLPDGVLEIEMGNQFRDGEALAAELREYGIAVDIETVPSSPSLVGQVWVHNQTGGDYIPEGMRISPDGSPNPKMTIDPAAFREQITIKMHVAAAPGERYTTSAEVFAPGEVLGGLHCALGQPLHVADVVPYLDSLELDAQWNIATLTPEGPAFLPTDETPEGTILSGYAIDASTVRFDVDTHDVTLPPTHATPHLSDVPCTPDQANAWN